MDIGRFKNNGYLKIIDETVILLSIYDKSEQEILKIVN